MSYKPIHKKNEKSRYKQKKREKVKDNVCKCYESIMHCLALDAWNTS